MTLIDEDTKPILTDANNMGRCPLSSGNVFVFVLAAEKFHTAHAHGALKFIW